MQERLRRLASIGMLALLVSLLLLGANVAVADQHGVSPPRVIVQLEDAPLATYRGQVAGYAATSISVTGGDRLDTESRASRAYLGYLRQQQSLFGEALKRTIPGAEIQYSYRILLNGLAVRLASDDAKAWATLEQMAGVKAVYREKECRLALNYSVPWIGAPAIWDTLGGVEQAGDGIKIAILDSGIYINQPFFDPSGYAYPAGFPKGDRRYTTPKVIVARAYFRPDDPPAAYEPPTPIDGNEHGTHVSGIAAGVAGTQTNDGPISGVAPRAWLMNYKLFYSSVSGKLSAFTPEVVAAMEDAVADGADVANGSWGGGADLTPEADPMVMAADAMVEAGVVVVFAAGNQGPTPISLNSPAISRRAIAVANTSTDKHGRPPDNVQSTSSRGPGLGLTLKPDIAAPGASIYSSYRFGFGTLGGTSMASPHVAGAAALLRQLHPTWTADQVKSALMGTANTEVFYAGQRAGVMTQGAGRVDLARAQDPGLLLSPPSFSFGEMETGATANASISALDVAAGGLYTVTVEGPQAGAGVTLTTSSPWLVLAAGEEKTSLSLELQVDAGAQPGEYEGRVWLRQGDRAIHLPWWVRVVSAEPQADILLLDDDASSIGEHTDYAPYYTALLDEMGLTYELWDVGVKWQQSWGRDTGSLPTVSHMKSFGVVIWFSGDNDRTYSKIGARMGDRTALLDYLQSGGNLLAAGRDLLGYGLRSEDESNLLEIGMGIDMALVGEDAYSPGEMTSPFVAAEGLSSAPAFRGMQFDLGSSGPISGTLAAGAGNAMGIDELVPIIEYEAEPILRALMPGSTHDGALGVAKGADPTLETPLPIMPPGRSVCLAFGLESIDDTSGHTTRKALLRRILEWFADQPAVEIADASAANPHDLVKLAATASSNVPASVPTRYRWDLGDGSPLVETRSASVSHVYGRAGTYHPRVEVTDSLGHTAVSNSGTVLVDDGLVSVYVPLLSAGSSGQAAEGRSPDRIYWHVPMAGYSWPELGVGSDISASWKRVDKSKALPGDILSYTLAISNTGSITSSVQVRDDLPRTNLVSFVPGTLSASQGTATRNPSANDGYGRVHWNGDVGPGQEVTIAFRMQVSQLAPQGATITNEAIFGDETAHLQWYDQASTTVVAPDISNASKAANKEAARQGEQVTYTLRAHNRGTATASVRIQDSLPRTAAAGFVASSLRSSRGVAIWDPIRNDGYGIVRWAGDLAPGRGVTLTYQLLVNAGAPAGTWLTNTAAFTETTTGAVYTEIAETQVIAADLGVSHKSVDKAQVAPSDSLHYTIIASNDGSAATTVQVRDLLPRVEGLVLRPGSLGASIGQATWHPSQNDGYGTIFWTGVLEPAQVVAIGYELGVGEDVPTGTVITNAVTFKDTDTGRQWQSATRSLVVTPDLARSSKAVDKELALPGEALRYSIIARNDGSAPANAHILDKLPRVAHTSLVTDSIVASWGTATYEPEANDGYGAISWRGSLAPGQSLTISFTLGTLPGIQDNTTITNLATFQDVDLGLTWSDVVTTLIASPNLGGSTKQVSSEQVHPGQDLTYTIVGRNTGLAPAAAIIVDALPRTGATAFISGTLEASRGQALWRPGANDGYGDVLWEGALGANEAVTVTYRLDVKPSAPPEALITNHVTFSETTTSALWTDSVTSLVVAPDIGESFKSVDKANVGVGQQLAYTLVAKNTGNAATNMHVRDNLPHTHDVSLAPDSLDASSGQADWIPAQNDGYGMVYWSGLVNAGQAVTITFQMTVTATATPGTLVTNTVLFGDDVGRQVADQVSSRIVAPDLSASAKLVDKESAHSGQVITYTLAARNTGDYPTLALVTDTLPASALVELVPGSIMATKGLPELDPAANDGHGILTWRGNLVAGEAVTITFQMQVGQVTSPRVFLANTADFYDAFSDARHTTWARTELLAANIASSRKLVDKSVAGPGETLRYTVLGRNTGPVTATLLITDVLPATSAVALVPESVTADRGEVVSHPADNGGYGTLTWRGEMGPYSLVTISFDMAIARRNVPEGDIVNLAIIRDLDNGALVTDTAKTALMLPDISNSAMVADKEAALIGRTISYALVAVNDGSFGASLQVSNPLPHAGYTRLAEGTLAATMGRALYDPAANDGHGLIMWQGDLGAGETVTVTYGLRIDVDAPAREVITNSATFLEMRRGQQVERSARTSVLAPDLSGSSKSVDKAEVRPGGVLTYTILAHNAGNVAATARITDLLPHNGAASFVPGSLHAEKGQALWNPEANEGYGLVAWVVQVAPGESIALTFQARVDEHAAQGEAITNRALFWDAVRDAHWEDTAATLILPPERRTVYFPLVIHTGT